jgi:alkanesulfonate monooxygenase SsuD/methylene tetrahydromethanopterin reductase-like flavin-dependent oxidoreductase (luciferase family)
MLNSIQIGPPEQTYLKQIANREVVGFPEDVKAAIIERADRYGADEVLLTSITYRPEDKLNAYRLIAQAFSLESRD